DRALSGRIPRTRFLASGPKSLDMWNMPKAQYASYDPADEFPFAVDDYLLHLVVAIYQFRDSRLDQVLRPLGLNVSRYRVLSVLERFGASTMTELASFTAMERTTLTRIADQLVAADFVTRA